MPVEDGPKTTTISFRTLVLRVDPDYNFESNHPIVYRFPGKTGLKRDKGADAGIYTKDS